MTNLEEHKFWVEERKEFMVPYYIAVQMIQELSMNSLKQLDDALQELRNSTGTLSSFISEIEK